MENEKALEGSGWLCLIEWSTKQSKAFSNHFKILYFVSEPALFRDETNILERKR